MECLVDTSVLAQAKLSHRALNLIADGPSELYLSAVSSWVGTGKLVLPGTPRSSARPESTWALFSGRKQVFLSAIFVHEEK
jgi:PIN domain nuclease of toxin-antitoxin system